MARNTIKRPFLHESRDTFADLVAEHLQLVLPNITTTKRLGELDIQGMDIIQFEENDGAAIRAVQCKGYERPLNAGHITELCNEAKKFLQRGPIVDEYWLVVNKSIKRNADRNRIEAELSKLIEGGKARSATLLDIDPFAIQLERLAIEKFRRLARSRREIVRRRYLRSFNDVGYLPEVPSNFDGFPTHNPIDTIVQTLSDRVVRSGDGHTGRSRNFPRFLVTGSFGFGKTLSLHSLGQLWTDHGFDVLFIPAVKLHDEAFVNSAGIYDFVIGDLFEHDEEFSKEHVGYRLIREACKKVLGSEPWMLLIDAIDESEFWQDPNRLRNLWTSIREIGLPAVVTVRTELVDSRPAEFIGDHDAKFFTQIELTDWHPEQMSTFLDAFAAKKAVKPPASFRAFQSMIREGKYERRYGDIPRRPLFLHMLAEDAWAGANPETQLFRLYGKYFRAKLLRDWIRADLPERTVRMNSVLKRFGIEEAQEQLIALMQTLALNAAGYCEREELVIQNLRTTQVLFTQSDLDACVEAAIGEVPNVEEILLSSLIQPAGRDSITRHRQYRFAHQSFFDWFLARVIVERQLTVTGMSPTARAFQAQIASAIAAGEALP